MSFALRERGRALGWLRHFRSNAPADAYLISPLDQRSNQTQEFLLLWPAASGDEKSSDLNVGDLST
jgi:hypothetical protein